MDNIEDLIAYAENNFQYYSDYSVYDVKHLGIKDRDEALGRLRQCTLMATKDEKLCESVILYL